MAENRGTPNPCKNRISYAMGAGAATIIMYRAVPGVNGRCVMVRSHLNIFEEEVYTDLGNLENRMPAIPAEVLEARR
jgi:hypothetical protein